MKRRFIVAFVAFALAGCAHRAVQETITPYHGNPVKADASLTFDGGEFRAGDALRMSREEVQSVQFTFDREGETQSAGPAEQTGLTPLAQGLLERGRAAADQYAGVSGVILVDDGVFTYRKNGSSSYRYHFAGLVLKEEAKSWAQFSAGFTEGRSRVTVEFARSVSPDGTVYAMPEDALRVGSPSEEMQFFNPNRKVLSGVIPGVEVGSVIEYAYRFEQYDPEDRRLFFPGYFFQGADPVVLSRVEVSVPKGTPFNYVTRNFPDGQTAEPVVEEKENSMRYRWQAEDMPPLVQEPFMPPEQDVVPLMDGSIFESWDAAFELQRKLQEPRMSVTPQIEAAAAEIVADADTADAKVARLYHWVQTNTRYISIKGSLGAGWSGHTAQETFQNRYGDCTDKAILFATLCKAIGVTAYPIILRTNDAGIGITEIPTMDGNHAINKVVFDDGRSLYLDSTAQDFRYPYFRPDDHGAYAINSVLGEIEPIPVPPPQDNARESELDVSIAANGDVAVETRNRYTGPYEAGVRGFWKQVREDERPQRMSQYVNSISPGAVLGEFALSNLDDLSEPLTMRIAYALPGHAIRAKDLLYLRVPTLERDYPEAALEMRMYPVQYATAEERILRVRMAVPGGFRLKWAPPPLELASPYLEYRAAYREEPGAVVLEETFRRLKRIVPVEDYPQFRDHLRAISAFTKKEIFLTEED